MSTNITEMIANRIKINLGITHTALDDEITARIGSGRKEYTRLGITENKATGNDPLIVDGLIAYVCKTLASDKSEREGWDRSWQIISTALKDSSDYYEEESDV